MAGPVGRVTIGGVFTGLQWAKGWPLVDGAPSKVDGAPEKLFSRQTEKLA
jgi:hypothetical protein